MSSLGVKDVVIVGGGLAGSLAAVLLGRAGFDVAIVDRHEIYPPDFRAEQIVGVQVEAMRRLGVLDAIVAEGIAVQRVLNVQGGRTLDLTASEQYGLPYERIVGAIRGQIPSTVSFVTAKVDRVETSDAIQGVGLADGRTLTARLVILATGLNAALSRAAGIERETVRDCHSVSIGFDLEPAAPVSFDAMTYYGERIGDGIDYLSLFRVPGGLRANLFVYWGGKDERLKRFKSDAATALNAALPGLSGVIGAFTAAPTVQIRPVDLYHATGYRRAGIALVGDAFKTSCPAAGTGIERVLCDVEQLCTVHIPAWLASPGMAQHKIAAFYDNPAKRAVDARAAHISEYRRSVTVETTLPWRFHRFHVTLRRRWRHWLGPALARLPRGRTPQARPLNEGSMLPGA